MYINPLYFPHSFVTITLVHIAHTQGGFYTEDNLAIVKENFKKI